MIGTMSFRILPLIVGGLGLVLNNFTGEESIGIEKTMNSDERWSHEIHGVLSCPPEVVEHESDGAFPFPRTRASTQGTLAYSPCPYGGIDSGAIDFFGSGSVCKGTCVTTGGLRYCFSAEAQSGSGVALWFGFRSQMCRSRGMDTAIDTVETATMSPITEENVQNVMSQIEAVANYAPIDYHSARTMVGAISQILHSVSLFSQNSPLWRDIRQQLFDHLHNYTGKVTLGRGQKVTVESSDILVETLMFPEDNAKYFYTCDTFAVPSEVVSLAQELTIWKHARLEVRKYANSLFEHWNPPPTFRNESTEHFGKNKWRVYDVHFADSSIVDLTTPVTYSFELSNVKGFKWTCVFWNPYERAWSDVGMKTIQVNNTINCEATHLTAFSVILCPASVTNADVPSGSSEIHEHILSLLSSVGSALSIFGLVLTFLTYVIIRSLRRERSNQILLNLSSSLFLLHTLSLCASRRVWSYACAVPAALLHYFLLTSLTWMLIDAMFMYHYLITVFVPPESKFLVKRLLVGWGFPLVLVILTALIDHTVYTGSNLRFEFCVIAGHLNATLYYATYFVPCVIIVLCNTFIFGRIMVLLCCQNSQKHKEFNFTKGQHPRPTVLSPIQIKGAMTLFVIFGISWTFALAASGPLELPMRYAHTILNGVQGLLLFILRVVMDRKVIEIVRRSVWTENDASLTTFGTDLASASDKRSSRKTSLSSARGPAQTETFKF